MLYLTRMSRLAGDLSFGMLAHNQNMNGQSWHFPPIFPSCWKHIYWNACEMWHYHLYEINLQYMYVLYSILKYQFHFMLPLIYNSSLNRYLWIASYYWQIIKSILNLRFIEMYKICSIESIIFLHSHGIFTFSYRVKQVFTYLPL